MKQACSFIPNLAYNVMVMSHSHKNTTLRDRFEFFFLNTCVSGEQVLPTEASEPDVQHGTTQRSIISVHSKTDNADVRPIAVEWICNLHAHKYININKLFEKHTYLAAKETCHQAVHSLPTWWRSRSAWYHWRTHGDNMCTCCTHCHLCSFPPRFLNLLARPVTMSRHIGDPETKFL